MKYFSIAILTIACFVCHAQKKPALRFEHIDEHNGLSNKEIRSIYCDSRGFLWFGTNDGLNRFDGSGFVYYRHNNIDTTSIAGNDINTLFEDSKHNLWIGAHCFGLSKMNTSNGKCVNYYADGKASSLQSTCDVNFAEDKDGNIWVCDRSAISSFNKDGKTFENYFPFPKGDHSAILHMALNKNNIWFSHFGGLRSFDIVTHRFYNYDSLVKNCTCGSVKVTSEGYILLCTWQNGFYIFDPATKKLKHFFNQLTTNDVSVINMQGHQQLWIASSAGLYIAAIGKSIFDIQEKDFAVYKHNASDATSLSDDNVTCIYADSTRNEAVWLGTLKGINKVNLLYQHFTTHVITKSGEPFTTTDLANIFIEHDKHNNTVYWLSYWHGTGLLETDSAFHIKKQVLVKSSNGISEIVSNVQRGKDGYLWMATWDGLWCYDDEKNRLVKDYTQTGGNWINLSSNDLDYLLQDKKGQLWIGTYGKGVDVINFKDSTVRILHVKKDKNLAGDNRSDFIFEDSKGRIWAAGQALQQYNEKTKQFDLFASKPGDSTSLPGKVNTIFEDDEHRIWICTDAGMALFDDDRKTFRSFTSEDGLPGDRCNAVTEDRNGNLWVCTSGGLCCINTLDFRIRSYTISDGLPVNQLGNSIFTASDGSIYFSLDEGNSPLISFDPAILLEKKFVTPFHFTSLNILGVDQLFDEPIDELKSIHLSYKQNVFTISFKALDYRNAANVRYQYLLEGFNDKWIDVGHRNNVTFTNLDGGTYTLLVKATDASGTWINKELKLSVIIDPPFWKTWWFYVLSIAAVAVAVYIIFTKRVKHIRNEEEKKRSIDNEMSDLKMKALKAQMNPHFVFNSLSSIQESIVNGNTSAAAMYLGKFSKLIRIVLDFSDSSLISLHQEKDYLQLYLELESFRFENFYFKIIVPQKADIDFIKIPPMLVQPFVENAIKHGLSHKNGAKSVSIIFEETADQILKVTIDDNGIGRAAAQQINATRQFQHQSVGMQITSNRLSLLQKKNIASLSVTDKIDEAGNAAGTTVTITIPTGTT